MQKCARFKLRDEIELVSSCFKQQKRPRQDGQTVKHRSPAAGAWLVPNIGMSVYWYILLFLSELHNILLDSIRPPLWRYKNIFPGEIRTGVTRIKVYFGGGWGSLDCLAKYPPIYSIILFCDFYFCSCCFQLASFVQK